VSLKHLLLEYQIIIIRGKLCQNTIDLSGIAVIFLTVNFTANWYYIIFKLIHINVLIVKVSTFHNFSQSHVCLILKIHEVYQKIY